MPRTFTTRSLVVLPMNINPALTGLFRGDTRFIGNYRSQWNKVPVKYMTFTGGIEQKFTNSSLKNSLFSGGLLFNFDEAGDLELSTTNLALSGSYTHRLGKKHFLTGGTQLGGAQRRFNTTKLRTDAQYDDGGYNGQLSSGETFDHSSIFYMDLSGGVNYRFQNPEKRTRFDIGLGIFHVNTPNQSFYEDEMVNLPERFAVYGMTSFALGSFFDLGLQAVGQFQGPHQEIVVGVLGKALIDQRRDRELSLALGLTHRLDDAWIPNIILDYRMWSFSFSYDITTSPFEVASFNRGGPELSVIYIFTKVQPPKEFEICPIF